MAAQELLFCSNVPLWHWCDLSDFVYLCKVLTDSPFRVSWYGVVRVSGVGEVLGGKSNLGSIPLEIHWSLTLCCNSPSERPLPW